MKEEIDNVAIKINPNLKIHPIVTEALSKRPSTTSTPTEGDYSFDLEEMGLSDKLHDNQFLNELQSGVSTWIAQIRKVTVLPGTTSFPIITNADDYSSSSS